eukprot:2310508-Amphidinium_carterae.1
MDTVTLKQRMKRTKTTTTRVKDQSAGTTRASTSGSNVAQYEPIQKSIKGEGKKKVHKTTGQVVTNLYNAKFTNVHAAAPPPMTRTLDDPTTNVDTRCTPCLPQS